MEEKIKDLKKLNAAYIASQEFDMCPDSEKATDVAELFETGVSIEILREALDDNQFSRPYEIADKMSELIKTL